VIAALGLVLAVAAAIMTARRVAAGGSRAEGLAAGFIVGTALVVVPIQFGAALELLGLVPTLSLLPPAVASAMVVGWLRARSASGRPAPDPDPSPIGRVELAAGLIIGVPYFLFSLDRITGFPVTWDGVAYHLPLAVKWLQDGSLGIEGGANWRGSLPANAEIVAMMALGTGWQSLAEVSNLASAAGLGAGGYLIGRGIGASRSAAWAGVLLILSVPVVLYQTFSSYVDLFGTASLIAALGLIVRQRTRERSPLDAGVLAVAGLGCGLAIGTKPTFWVPAAIVAIAGLVRVRGVSVPGALAIYAGAVLAPALFWFGRALGTTGNPFYPVAVEIAGRTLLAGFRPSELVNPEYYLGLVRSPIEWLGYPWIEYKRAGYGWSPGSGLGPLFAALVPIGVIATLVQSRHRPVGPARLIPLLLLGGVVVVAVAWWLVGQGPHLRFALPMIAILCVMTTPWLTDVRVARPRIVAGLLLTGAVVFGKMASLDPAVRLASRIRHQTWSRDRFYGVPPLVDSLPACAAAVNFNPPREFWSNFALAGHRLTNRVIPPWEARDFLDGPPAGPCPIYVFDREPFLDASAEARLTSIGYRPLPLSEQPAWRAWVWPGR
jgi:hypothetical protein